MSGPGGNNDGLNGEVDVAVVDKNKGGASSGSSCKRGRDEEGDQGVQEGIKRGGGARYLEEEEVKIVNYIVARKAYDRVNGSGLWSEMEKEKILEDRTSRGMKGRFDRVIIKNIKTGKKNYGLPEQEISLFCSGRKVEDAGEQEEEKEDKGAEIIANAKKGDLTSNGDHVDVLKQHIEDHRLCLVFRECTEGDGNCWYRAGADQVVLHNLLGLPRDHKALRELVTSSIPSLPQYDDWLADVFGGDVEAFERFLHHHSQDGVWTDVDGIICQATALIFKRRIQVVGTNNKSPRGFFILESVPGSEELPPLTIGHYYDQHYQSLARVEPPSETFGEDETVSPLMEGERKEEEDDDDEREKAGKAGAIEENPFFVGSDDDGDDDDETDGAVGGSKEPVNEREEKDLASRKDEAAKDVEEEKEPNTEDESRNNGVAAFGKGEEGLSAEERKGDEDDSGREGGLALGLI